MYYFIEYEYEGKVYNATVNPNENPMYRIISLTDSGAKIVGIKTQNMKKTLVLINGNYPSDIFFSELKIKPSEKLKKFFLSKGVLVK